jgi:putative spermidine/putrescine transport system permease protein
MLALPYVVMNVGVSIATLDPRLALAASGLGAGPWRVFHTVTLPSILPGMIGGGVFAFVTSFDEVVLAVFLAGPSLKTLPCASGRRCASNTRPLWRSPPRS